jgi:hypothetical protein
MRGQPPSRVGKLSGAGGPVEKCSPGLPLQGAGLFAAARLPVPPPQAAFYIYPDFEPWREHLWSERGVRTGTALARHLLEHYGAGVLPASRGSPTALGRIGGILADLGP